MKAEKRKQAIEMRKNGEAITIIAKKLHVAKSSVSCWVRDVYLDQMAKDKLNKSKIRGCKIAARNISETHRIRRLNYQKNGSVAAKKDDLLHAMGCMLYWAEGQKSRNACSLSNTDPYLLKLFVRFLKQKFAINNNDIAIRLNCYIDNGKTIKDIENYWIKTLDINGAKINKHTIKKFVPTARYRKNKYPYGVCTIVVSRTELVQHIYGAIQEYAGFNNNYCLD